jgi:hypothetical protein
MKKNLCKDESIVVNSIKEYPKHLNYRLNL